MSIDKAKKAAAEHAVALVEDGMVVGLGTGSTAYFAIKRLGERVMTGLKITGVPTSVATAHLAQAAGIPLQKEFDTIDLTIDGADEVDEQGSLIKGGGGALTREKIVAAASKREIIIVDERKVVKQLGAFPLPVEVLPFAHRFVAARLQALGCETHLRRSSEQVFMSDNSNWIVDCEFGQIEHAQDLERRINLIPGVIENGLFVGLISLLIVGTNTGNCRTQEFQA